MSDTTLPLQRIIEVRQGSSLPPGTIVVKYLGREVRSFGLGTGVETVYIVVVEEVE
jgi:hypothetical protein